MAEEIGTTPSLEGSSVAGSDKKNPKPHLNPRVLHESRLTLLGLNTSKKGKRGVFFSTYQCSCGNIIEARVSSVNTGQKKSCGCIKKERPTKTNKHLYWVYDQIKRRCLDTGNKHYKDYGGRGIAVYEEWVKDFRTFLKWSIENGYVRGLTIDRINNDGNYEPSNCRWTTQLVQTHNTRRNVKIDKIKEVRTLLLKGHTLDELVAMTGMPKITLQRIRGNKIYRDDPSFVAPRRVLTDAVVAEIRNHLASGLSQKKTAKLVGVSSGSVQHVSENRHRKIKTEPAL